MSELKTFEDQMKKVIEKIQLDFSSIRIGRAHISLLDGVKVEYFGSNVPVQQVASVGTVDGRTLEIKPWDQATLKLIEQAILKSDLGITPMNDGKVIRLTMPTPTTERKMELVRTIKKQAEDFKVAVRNVRRDAVEMMKKSEKDKKITQDDLRRSEQSIQKMTDQYIRKIEEIVGAKEKDIMEV